MTSYIGKKIARKAFAGQAAGLEPADPHYETYVDNRGRTKSRKRKMPAGLSKRDERILRSVRRRAHYLDKGFTLCGFRFGWTAILGLIPLAGDIASFLLGYFLVLRKCRQADLPFALSQRMAFNQAVSLGIGLVPMVGDLCAAVWKTNSRNAALLEEFLIQRATKDSEGNQQTEEQAAASVLASAQINPLTGERKGGPPPYSLSAEVQAEREGAESPERERVQPARKKSWYGWGAGKRGPAAAQGTETAPLAAGAAAAGGSSTATAAPIMATGTSTTDPAVYGAAGAGGSKLKKGGR